MGSEVFISYAADDHSRVEPLANAIEQMGRSVWWDRTIPVGSTFDEVIENALDEAKCVVVVWSANSVASRWVRTEATDGLDRGILIPVLIDDDVRLPLEFRRVQTADLIDWQPGKPHGGFDRFVLGVEGLVPRPPSDEGEPIFAAPPAEAAPDTPTFAELRSREDWVWSKWDEKDLGEFVNPDVIYILGRLPEEPNDQPEDADGRRRILELIYDKLLESDISYALEKFNYADDVHNIRRPSEILSGAGRGTCLDLSLLFAGLAEGYDLIPIVVVMEGHVFVMVSLENSRREWDSFGRFELQEFMEPVKEIEVLRMLVSDGTYVAIECTGFAASEKLRDNPERAFPETLGRNEMGLMPFEQALVSGRAQLFDRPEDLGFALDVTVVHRHKEPLKIGDATLMVAERQSAEAVTVDTAHGEASVAAAGEDLVEMDLRSEHGAKVNPAFEAEGPAVIELPTPVRPRVKPIKGFVDRQLELQGILSALADNEGVSLVGEAGVGRTALLRRLAYDGGLSVDFPDGVVYLTVPQQPIEDVLQDIHDHFYRADTPATPILLTIKQRLADKRALVILDELEMDSASVEDLTYALPESAFVIARSASNQQYDDFVRVIKLRGLDLGDALEFLQKRLGREIAEEERDAAREICGMLDGHPGSLIEAAMAVLGGQSLAEVARTYQGTTEPSAEVAEAMLADLSPIQQKVAEILDVAKVPVTMTLLERVLADDLQGVPDGLHDAVRALIAIDRAEPR